MFRRYFEEEMRYLHEAGKLFAQSHPEQARMLNVDSVSDRDPYVERLFEGFAFLTGRIREQLDDELPEYTENLCQLLFPHMLRPVPALALQQFRPKPGAVQGRTVVPRGTELVAEPAGERRTACRFTTTQDVALHPLSLAAAELAWQPDGTSSVTLRFNLESSASYGDLGLDRLRLHLHADPTRASTMHLFFTRHVRKVIVRSKKDSPDATALLGQQWVRPGGLAPEESLLPGAEQVFSGFRLLQEYLVFRRKFWCIDLHGFERFVPDDDASSFEVEVVFDRSFPETQRFRADDLRLFCTPVVNLFAHDAEPVRVDHRVPEYRVVPSVSQDLEVYDVLHGVGTEERSGRRHVYEPFFQFDFGRKNGQRYFTQNVRFGPTGRFETFVNLNTLDEERPNLSAETLSLETRCTNGTLPREKLQEGTIRSFAPGTPEVARMENLTQPSLILYPPLRHKQNFFWKMISHWSLNYQTAASREAVCGLLELYDWTATDANRRRIGGVRKVEWAPKERVARGVVVRGAEVTVQVQEDHFADEGDVVLFGLVLSEFFSMFATLNSFVHLTLEALLSGKTYRWQPTRGTQPIL